MVKTKRQQRSHANRTLTFFALGVILLSVLAALGKTWAPGLGLDLRGGTRITLVAEQQNPTPSQLSEAASIIDNRVNGSGVAEAAVSTQGNRNIVVEVPGSNARDLVDAVKRTAQLRFRLVAQCQGQPCVAPGTKPTASASASPSASPSASASSGASASPSAKASAKPKKKAKPTKQSASASPSASPAETKGAAVTDPLKWQDNPGSAWIKKFDDYTCPAKGSPITAAQDDPKTPIVTCDSDGQKQLLSAAVIEGSQLKTASFGLPDNGATWAVNLSFKSSATKTFGDVTTKLAGTGKLFAIVLDGAVLSSPRVIQPILDGRPQITGNFTQKSAESLATSLKYGALPLRFSPSVENIGPQLAGNQLNAGIWAGIIGLLLVMIYCLLYYRGLGLVVIGSLIVAGVVTYAAVLVLSKAAGFTLTLPGIAGLIVAVGITADSFIVYFERIRDEMREGKSMRVAVETGWVRARNTCLAADAVSLLAAVVLYFFAIGVVKGFAFALGLSTVIDLVVFFFFTKPIMTILARHSFFNGQHRLSGLSEETLGLDAVHAGVGTLQGGRA